MPYTALTANGRLAYPFCVSLESEYNGEGWTDPRRAKGWRAMLGNVIWVIAVIGFWAVVFGIVTLLVSIVARERDSEQLVCELPENYWQVNLAGT